MTVHRMVESEMKKKCHGVKKKYSGNSVHLRLYAHVLSISKHIHLILCISFVMPSSDFNLKFLLFISALPVMRLLSTVHCHGMLEPKMTNLKRYVQTMNICNPSGPDYTDT